MPSAPLLSIRGEHHTVPLPVRAVWRYFVTGTQLRGPGDNATLFHHATVDYRARPYLKLSRRRWERIARRNAAITVPAALTAASVTPWIDLWMVGAYEGTLATAATAWSVHQGVKWTRTHRANREWVDPAARLLCGMVNERYTRKKGRSMIDLPAGWGVGAVGEGERQAVRITIPAGTALDARLKGRIAENVGARLGIPAPVQGEWMEAGSCVTALLSAAPVPPKDVPWGPFARALAEGEDDAVIVGRKPGGGLVTLSLSEDSPHFAMSGAAGTGKSVLAKLILAQRGARGDGIIITDPKRFSHWRWAGPVKLSKDKVIYAYRDADLHETWLAIGEEIKRRIELPEEQLAHERRVFVLVEEANVQAKKLIRYWRAERKRLTVEAKLALADDAGADIELGDLDPPVQSPAIVAMQESVCMGRELKIHVVVAAQRLSASVFGGNGGDIRESFQGGRMIAKWDRKLWKMLVDTIAYVACPSGPRGIWGVARGEDFEIFRVPFLSDEDATAMVVNGEPATGPVLGVQDGRRPTLDVQDVRQVTAGVKLSDVLDKLPGQDGPAALSLEGLRSASKRPGFPSAIGQEGRAWLYDLDEIVAWRQDVLDRD